MLCTRAGTGPGLADTRWAQGPVPGPSVRVSPLPPPPPLAPPPSVLRSVGQARLCPGICGTGSLQLGAACRGLVWELLSVLSHGQPWERARLPLGAVKGKRVPPEPPAEAEARRPTGGGAHFP